MDLKSLPGHRAPFKNDLCPMKPCSCHINDYVVSVHADYETVFKTSYILMVF